MAFVVRFHSVKAVISYPAFVVSGLLPPVFIYGADTLNAVVVFKLLAAFSVGEAVNDDV